MTTGWTTDQRGHFVCFKCQNDLYSRPQMPRQSNRPQKIKAQSVSYHECILNELGNDQ